MELRVDDKVALVTGASSGLGRHFALTLAKAGARVAVVARRKDRLNDLVVKIETFGGTAIAFELDVTDRSHFDVVLDLIEKDLGAVEILINNAGIAVEGNTLEMADDDLDNILDVNTKALWLLAKRVSDRLVKNGKSGSIINIASILGLNVSPGLSLYAISKAAVVQMTKALAADLWRHNIRVNAICPGYFKTEINSDFFDSDAGQKAISKMPPRRLGEYEELSGLLLLLASDASSFMTGTAIPIDGGHSVKLA